MIVTISQEEEISGERGGANQGLGESELKLRVRCVPITTCIVVSVFHLYMSLAVYRTCCRP